ncbi:type I-C CRISPR-associated protein Cas8c/Csd1 [Desulfobulbus sp.]|uniref:type I-C CRISPR-associated protein Cas8c/Csd1 n=1 Tax=Desulfobulbus sp. TaxID=895 RepID=UPI00286F11D9|nr:type I-C CRISPR-associated protein Cas8c/Csd1 [Desulfobulbus sp.]
MILQALKEYYDRKAADPYSGIAPPGWEWKEIPFLLVLDGDANLVSIEDTREKVEKKKRVKTFLVPQGVKRSVGIAANFLWDNVEGILKIRCSNLRRIKQLNC